MSDASLLRERLEARSLEIERLLLTRISAISDPDRTTDADYVHGLRAAVRTALEFGLTAIDADHNRPPPLPVALLAQARSAVRNGVSLDIVLRRYFAGYVVLGDFIMDEVQRGEPRERIDLKRLLRDQGVLFDRLLAAIGEEYAREAGHRPETLEQRRAERVGRLLAGEMLDTRELAYDFDARHVGVVASGANASRAIRVVAAKTECRLLIVTRDEGVVWAWIGARQVPKSTEIAHLFESHRPGEFALALGEPAEGLAGWRLTHRQAAAALLVAIRGRGRIVRYRDVPLLAAALRDELLSTSLRQFWLEPLDRARDGGKQARETLRAYFLAGQNVSSAAASLGANRNTVASRLRVIEDMIGEPLSECVGRLQAALALERLGGDAFDTPCL